MKALKIILEKKNKNIIGFPEDSLIYEIISEMQCYKKTIIGGFDNSKQISLLDNKLSSMLNIRKPKKGIKPWSKYNIADNYMRIIDEKNLKYTIKEQK